jgi:hypothetical protein
MREGPPYGCTSIQRWGLKNLEGEVPFLTYTTRVSIGRTSQVSTPSFEEVAYGYH